MGYPHNQLQSESDRKRLRSNQTFAEKVFWEAVRGKELGVRFRRQHGVGSFTLDFYCSELRLAIELDGEYHLEKTAQLHDEQRTKFLSEFSISVLRFSNKEILEDLDRVIKHLKERIAMHVESHK